MFKKGLSSDSYLSQVDFPSGTDSKLQILNLNECCENIKLNSSGKRIYKLEKNSFQQQ